MRELASMSWNELRTGLCGRETERILREAVARQGVTPEWNTELAGIGQDALSSQG